MQLHKKLHTMLRHLVSGHNCPIAPVRDRGDFVVFFLFAMHVCLRKKCAGWWQAVWMDRERILIRQPRGFHRDSLPSAVEEALYRVKG